MAAVKTIVVGTGGMARNHIRAMLGQKRSTRITGFVEVAESQREAVRTLYAEKDLECPPFAPTLRELLTAIAPPDAAFICTPHKYHFEQARDCLQRGMDVCLEKPMVLNLSEARRLVRVRDKTGRLLVVAFPGSLSPAVRKAKAMIAAGAIGRVTGIAAYAHQRWKQGTVGTWRQDPEISGGGFLFDTGSHMINTVIELMDDDVAQVSAILDNRGTPVEIASSVSGMSRRGILFSLAGAGDSMQCASSVHVFGDAGVLETGIWGERLRIKSLKDPDYKDVPYQKSRGVWEQFLKVRQGRMENPCPPEVGLRFAALMDMIRASAAEGRTVHA